jgi:uncharacterized SAM-binding protein YcdF (DUF218 family)
LHRNLSFATTLRRQPAHIAPQRITDHTAAKLRFALPLRNRLPITIPGNYRMSLSWIITNLASAVLLPPLNLVLLGAAGLLLRRRWRRAGLAISCSALALLLVFSTGAGSLLLVRPLEGLTPPLTAPRQAGAQAIVVLGGGRLATAPEYGGQDIPSYLTLARLRYAALLQRATGLPLLVTGGQPDGSAESEAALMARVLRQDFSVPVQWLEQESDNTAQNAQFSARILRQAGVQRILLVTDALHMPRSQAIFAQQGLQVVPAATIFFSRAPLSPVDFIPDGEGLRRSHYALHEWIGLLWYRLRHGSALPGDGSA